MARAKKNKEAGEAFKQLLIQKGFNNYRLAKETGLGRDHIGRIASGEIASPEPTTLAKIATVLGVELGELTRMFAQSNVQSQYAAANPQPQESVSEIPISNNSDFVGREDAIAHLNNLVNEGAKVILIHAEGGIGKTTLATKWLELQGLEYLELRVGSTSQNLNSVEDWVRIKLINYFKVNPEQNFITMLEQFKIQLKTRKVGILIDNLEPALINGEFIEPYYSYYVELLTVLADKSVQSITLITSREQIYEHTVKRLQTFTNYELDGLKQESWQQYFETCQISIDDAALSEMHQAYGGNAEAMFILTPEIVKKAQGNLKVYWQDNREDILRHRTIEKLVQRQFDKLKNDNIQAYKLLCRFGFYPNQGINVPKTWLFCLLWDVPKNRRQRVIDDLCDRSLIKTCDRGYYLHQVIKSVAIERFPSLPETHNNNLLLIKKQIDLLVASPQKLQKFLTWLHQKFCFASKKYTNAAFRAFYLGFVVCYNFNLSSSTIEQDPEYYELACNLDEAFDIYCRKYIQNTEKEAKKMAYLVYQKSMQLENKLIEVVGDITQQEIEVEELKQEKFNQFRTLIEKTAIECNIIEFYECKINQNKYIYENYLDFIAELTVEIRLFTDVQYCLEKPNLSIYDFIKNSQIEKLRTALIRSYKDAFIKASSMTIDDFKKELTQSAENRFDDKSQENKNNRYSIEINRYIVLKNEYMNGQSWELNKDEKYILNQYYKANNLLVACLDHTSEKVRSHIEDTLLLPIAEIEKRPFKY